MSNELYALTAIHVISEEKGTNAKIELAAEYLKDYPEIRYLLEAALSPYKHYGVTKRVKGQRKSKTLSTSLIGAIEVLDYSPKTKETFQQFDDDLHGLGLNEEDIDLVWKIVTKKLKIGIDQPCDLSVKSFPGSRTRHGRNEPEESSGDLHGLPLFEQYSALRHVEYGEYYLGSCCSCLLESSRKI